MASRRGRHSVRLLRGIVVAIGVAILFSAIGIGPAVVVLPIWAAWGLFLSYRMFNLPTSAADAAVERITASLLVDQRPPPPHGF